jgi:hypothetical protein
MHECDFYTQSVIFHAECGFHSHESSFDTYPFVYDTHECGLYTQSIISIRIVILTRTNVLTALTTVISTHTQEWFLHAECDFITYECDILPQSILKIFQHVNYTVLLS